jgi:hypothetical protein
MHGTSSWSRLLAGVLAIWFGLVMAAPVVLHHCPQEMASQAVSGTMAGHAHHASHHSSMPGDRAPNDCTCLGQCRGPVPAVLPRATIGPVAEVLPVADGTTFPVALVLPVALPDHHQPFATAPPLPQA